MNDKFKKFKKDLQSLCDRYNIELSTEVDSTWEKGPLGSYENHFAELKVYDVETGKMIGILD